jgi:hypothetical protein
MNTNSEATMPTTLQDLKEAAFAEQIARHESRQSRSSQPLNDEESRWQVKTFGDALAGSSSRPPWIIEDLLLHDTATVVSAQPHAMKSLSLLYACLESVAKGKVWNHFNAKDVKSTLFIETEDPAWLVEARIRGFAEGLNLKSPSAADGFGYLCVGPFDLMKEEQRIKAIVRDRKCDFVVLSTLQNLLVGLDWKSQQDMAPVMAFIVKLSREVPVILVTHSTWDKKVKRPAGTITQAANFMTGLHYDKTVDKKTGNTNVYVHVDSKAGAATTSFTLQLKTGGDKGDPGSVRTIEYLCGGHSKGQAKEAIIEAYEADKDLSNKEIAERAVCDVRYVQRVLKEYKSAK